ncbi:hypothetical protein E8E12_004463 [Didymella heteroderae]|uniref:Plasma membrane iron permease n=1 Tax=Didymella heteroderae TaxID=1769908 RepID=A0A9P4WJ23_9PLEO|nr:hypothetical protein E8E12_004463 [Didymella heteroderae]
MVQIFAAQVFFICLRESLETSIIVSVLLSFLKQTLTSEQEAPIYRKLVRQVWLGTLSGVAICTILGGTVITLFHVFESDVFSQYEYIWEGVFGLIACWIITIMGAALLRISKMRDKWRVKIAAALEANDDASGSKGLQVRAENPEIDGGGWWGVFNSIFGWQNSATYGSIISYNLYCIAVAAAFLVMHFREKHGSWAEYKDKSNARVPT